MKISVTVDLSELYLEDEESSMSDVIKDYVANQIKHQVIGDWKRTIKDEYYEGIREEVSKQKKAVIANTMNELLESGKIPKRYSTNDLVSIKEYIIEELKKHDFQDSAIQKTLNTMIDEQSKMIVSELKRRYDTQFATMIVKNLHENKMLKDDVAQLLLA